MVHFRITIASNHRPRERKKWGFWWLHSPINYISGRRIHFRFSTTAMMRLIKERERERVLFQKKMKIWDNHMFIHSSHSIFVWFCIIFLSRWMFRFVPIHNSALFRFFFIQSHTVLETISNRIQFCTILKSISD